MQPECSNFALFSDLLLTPLIALFVVDIFISCQGQGGNGTAAVALQGGRKAHLWSCDRCTFMFCCSLHLVSATF